jgi:nitroimidazol reductase NimA-like FMN-containing flavoprotein (pyridoxamine 5'-phosphate oxidase superfamily)
MIINTMNKKECQEFLAHGSIGRLGCALDNEPYVIPIYFACEDDYAYVLSTFGQKIEWMRINPKVCLQVDQVATQSQWVSVVVNGMYEELPEPQYATEREHARTLLQKRYRWWLNALAERQAKTSEVLIEPLFFRIRISSITGLRAEEKP